MNVFKVVYLEFKLSMSLAVMMFRHQLHCAWNSACHQKSLAQASMKPLGV